VISRCKSSAITWLLTCQAGCDKKSALMTTDKIVVFIRVQPETKAALEKAAKDDMRSLAVMVEKIVTDWLRAKGYLK